MQRKDHFNRFHPIVTVTFLMMALFWGMVLTHPIYLIVSALCSLLTALLLEKNTTKRLGYFIPAFFAISLINPLFNPRGDTVLFTYLGGRAYTLEALLYGMVLAFLFFTVANWFVCYNALVSSDQFLYLFGACFPAVSLLISMILKFIPEYERKLHAISAARSCVGKGTQGSSRREQIKNGTMMVSALTSLALENSLTTTDSMKSRGYGLKGRTSFSSYHFTRRDLWSEVLLIALCTVMVTCWVKGAAASEFIPTIVLAQRSTVFYIGITAYLVLLILPTVYIIFEEIKWNILRSKI